MKTRVARVGVLQMGKVLAVLYAFMSLIMLPFMLLGMWRHPASWMAILMLLAYPVMGFVGGIVIAALYNLAAKWIGGIEITLATTEEI